MVLKLVFIAIVSIFLSATIKQYNSEIAQLISICGGIIIFLLCIDEIQNIVDYFLELNNFMVIDSNYVKIILKIIGIGYVTEFTADIAEDFGNKTIASKVLLGGKVVVCVLTFPIIKDLLSSILQLLS